MWEIERAFVGGFFGGRTMVLMSLCPGFLRLNFLLTFLLYLVGSSGLFAAETRPNILWVTSEDNGPHLGAYGDSFADTPNLDRLAERGLTYLNAWSTAPVCAPARTTIISGLYPTSTGSEHMRSMTRLPEQMLMFPRYLREAGYYCSNNSKEDYNLEKTGMVWDESSREAHWNKRTPGQPFFSVFNFTVTHESQIRLRPHTPVHDSSRVRVPAYHPDTPEVRRDWAQYYDKVTEMDGQVGGVLDQLEEQGLAEDTIVFYWGDHGPGMPRSKRWPYNSGLHVPLIVSIPEKFRHLAPREYKAGGKTDRLVGFIDLAPTVLSLAGIEPPPYLQGHAFLGEFEGPEQSYLYGFRGRMDERYDLLRCVRDKRYIYIRNFMPHKIYGQYIAYMFQTPTTQVWKDLFDLGKLKEHQTYFWRSKPSEELYDLREDPDEINNLADSAVHEAILQRFRQAQREWVLSVRDVGFLPESEIHSRSRASSPYEMGHNEELYPLAQVLDSAEMASNLSMEEETLSNLRKAMEDSESAVRYWAAQGFLVRGREGVAPARAVLLQALEDPSPNVRIISAQALGQYGSSEDLPRALSVLIELAPPDRNGVYVSMLALNAIDALDGKAAPLRDRIEQMPTSDPSAHSRMRAYVPNLVKKILADLDAPD
jgi:uncharacterized sulfatase